MTINGRPAGQRARRCFMILAASIACVAASAPGLPAWAETALDDSSSGPAVPAGDGLGRMLTHEDIWLMKRVSSPVVSPDGRWVVFTVVDPAYEERHQWSDLWIVPTDGSAPPRRITSTRRPETGAAWSPDSRKLAFSSRREDDEVEQIYVIDVLGGGEAQRITDMTEGARAPRWSPDGTAILFTSNVYPEAHSEPLIREAARQRRERRYNARVYERAPIRHWDRWLDDRRPSLFVQSLEPGSKARNLLADTELLRSVGFGGRFELGAEVIDAAWTPDGTGIVFAATVNRHEWGYAEEVHSLWLVPAVGGEPRRLTADRASYRSPAFSRDGGALYALVEPVTDRVYNLQRLVRWSWPAFEHRTVLTKEFDRSVDAFVPSPDGKGAYLLAEDAGHVRLYAVAGEGGPVREVGRLESGCYGDLVAGGEDGRTVLVASWQSAVAPAEIGRIDPESGKWHALTSLNTARAQELALPPLQEFWFDSSRGRRIHSLMALPPGFDPRHKYPLFVVIHGGPHSMWRDQFVLRWNYHLLAAPGYVVLLTNYSGSTGYGERFSQSIQGDPLAGPASEINEAADEALRRFAFLDGTRQAAGGASYGGHLTNWLAVTTRRYKALVSHAGLFDLKTQWSTSDIVHSRERNLGGPFWNGGALWREQSPLYYASRISTPMLLTIGERDFRVPLNNTLELWTVLQRQRVPSRLVVFPEENHWILKGENSRYFYSEVHAWLARYLN